MTTTTDKRKALGRGLDILLPAARQSRDQGAGTGEQGSAGAAAQTQAVGAETQAAHRAPQDGELRELALDEIEANPYQTRHIREDALKEMADSIRAHGVMQPIIVRPLANGKFQLIAGERRLKGSHKAEKRSIPALVKQANDQQALEMTIIENLQREDLNPMEQARAYERLAREFAMTQEQMAQRTGKDRTTIANYLRLLKLPFKVQEELRYNFKITFSHAKLLLMLDSEEQISKAAEMIVRHNLSVLKTEELVYNMRNPVVRPATPARQVDPNVREAELELQRALGCRVRIKDRRGKGKIVIEYAQLDDFDRVMEALVGKGKK